MLKQILMNKSTYCHLALICNLFNNTVTAVIQKWTFIFHWTVQPKQAENAALNRERKKHIETNYDEQMHLLSFSFDLYEETRSSYTWIIIHRSPLPFFIIPSSIRFPVPIYIYSFKVSFCHIVVSFIQKLMYIYNMQLKASVFQQGCGCCQYNNIHWLQNKKK
jgi:hypothetical protein